MSIAIVGRFWQILLLGLATLSFSAAHAEEPDFAALYEASSSSVVTIYTAGVNPDSHRTERGLGSGVLIEEDRVITAAHVIQTAQSIEVHFKDGTRVPAVVMASLESSDIALLRLLDTHPDPVIATLADSNNTRVGEPVFIIGSPFGISQTLSVGHLSGRMTRGMLAGGSDIEFLQTDTAINTGNSGGPMFNVHGEVIGIVSFILSKSGGFDGIGFATSSNTAREALLHSSGLLAGFEGIVLDETLTRLLNLPEPGLLLQRVVKGSIAEKAGLRAGTIPAKIGNQTLMLGGDVIVAIVGLICANPHDFEALRNKTALDDQNTYSLRILRDGQEMELIAGAEMPSIFDQLDTSHSVEEVDASDSIVAK